MGQRDLRLTSDAAGPPAGMYLKDKTILPGQGHGWMGHDCAVVTLVLHGRLDEGFAARRQSCSSWELHYKPAGAVHTTTTGPEGARMFLLGLGGDAPVDLLRPIGDVPLELGGGIRAARALATFLDLASAPGGGPLDAGPVRRLLEDLADAWPTEPRQRPSWISEVRERVLDATADSVGLGRLANDFGVHPVYLARVFRKHYGSSIGAVRRRARVERAVTRMTRGARRLSDLALELGYSDQSHFTREFKKLTGWSPGRFGRTTAALARLGPV